MIRRAVQAAVAASLLAGVVFGAQAQEKQVMATVVKISGIPWFNRMEVGVKEYGAMTPSVTAFQNGPSSADAAQQLRIIEDLVARKVTLLAVVPMDPAVIEGVLKRAMDRGIVVVTHEADNQKNTMVNVEAFDNAAYGGKALETGQRDGQGQWTPFVGSLGSRTHLQWVGAGAENAKQYPEMKLVDANNESFDMPIVFTKRLRNCCASIPTWRVSRAWPEMM